MNEKEIINRLTANVDRADCLSRETEEKAEGYSKKYDKLSSMLNEKQKEMLFDLNYETTELNGLYFEDGVKYGFKLALSFIEVLKNPDKAFS